MILYLFKHDNELQLKQTRGVSGSFLLHCVLLFQYIYIYYVQVLLLSDLYTQMYVVHLYVKNMFFVLDKYKYDILLLYSTREYVKNT